MSRRRILPLVGISSPLLAIILARVAQAAPPKTYFTDNFENPTFTKANMRPAKESVWSPNYSERGIWDIITDPADPNNHVLSVADKGRYRAHLAVGQKNWGAGYIIDFDVMMYDPEREWDETPFGAGTSLFIHFYKQNDEVGSVAQSRAIMIFPRDNIYGMEKSWGGGRYNYWGSPLWHINLPPTWFYYAGPSHLDRWYRVKIFAEGVRFRIQIGKGKRTENLHEILVKDDWEREVYEHYPFGYLIFGAENGILIDNLTVNTIPSANVQVAPPRHFSPPIIYYEDFSNIRRALAWGGSAGYDKNTIFVETKTPSTQNEFHLKSYLSPDGKRREGGWAWRWAQWINYRITLRMKLLDHGIGEHSYANGCQITHVQNPECEYGMWIGGDTNGDLGRVRLQPFGMAGGQYPYQAYKDYGLGWDTWHDHIIDVIKEGEFLRTRYALDNPNNIILDYLNQENLCGDKRIYGGGLAIKSGYYVHSGHVALNSVRIDPIQV